MKKKFLLFLICGFVSSFCFAEGYKISSVSYEITGITQPGALERKVSIDYNRVFETEIELTDYLDSVVQKIKNLRLLENVEYSYSVENEGDVIVVFTAEDSKHFLVFPKPGYDSNNGFELKLKLKDTNFLGLMNELNSDINMEYGNSRDPENPKFTLGLAFDYDLPFNWGVTKNTWGNSFAFNYTFSESSPEFSYTTDLTIGLPLGSHTLYFTAAETVVKENDYEVYGDGLYFAQLFKISSSLEVYKISNYETVYFSPYASYSFNYDFDGIEKTNSALYFNDAKVGGTFSLANVNWQGNYREGYSASLSGYLSYLHSFDLVDENKFVPYVEASYEHFFNFNWIGINTRFIGFWKYNGTVNVGSYLRGTRNYLVHEGSNSVDVSSALVFSVDAPIHVVTTHWREWGEAMFGKYEDRSPFVKFITWLPYKAGPYVDFELQASLFMDMALVRNNYNLTYFDVRDGYYNGGIELLVYPAKWKSYVVRISAGFDVGEMLLKNQLNMNDRENVPGIPYEIFIGLGLQY